MISIKFDKGLEYMRHSQRAGSGILQNQALKQLKMLLASP